MRSGPSRITSIRHRRWRWSSRRRGRPSYCRWCATLAPSRSTTSASSRCAHDARARYGGEASPRGRAEPHGCPGPLHHHTGHLRHPRAYPARQRRRDSADRRPAGARQPPARLCPRLRRPPLRPRRQAWLPQSHRRIRPAPQRPRRIVPGVPGGFDTAPLIAMLIVL